MTETKPPADTSWVEMEGRRRRDVDDDVPGWLVALVVVLAVFVIVCTVILSVAGVEAYQFFHHANTGGAP